MQRDLAASYAYADGQQQRSPFLFCTTPPDGAISATATDMARFMIAHLQDGAYGDSRVRGLRNSNFADRRSAMYKFLNQ